MKKVLNKSSDSFRDLLLSIIISLNVRWKDAILNFQLYLGFCGSIQERDSWGGYKNQTKNPLRFCFRKIFHFRLCLALLKNT